MRISTLSLIVVAVLASSCTKTGGNSVTPSADSAAQTSTETSAGKGEPISASGILGKWNLSNPPRKNMSVELTFNPDGSFRMYSRRDVTDPDTRVKDIKGSWTQPDDKVVYLTKPGEKEVGVMEILSLDANSLVIHFKGEPDKEIMYFKRSK